MSYDWCTEYSDSASGGGIAVGDACCACGGGSPPANHEQPTSITDTPTDANESTTDGLLPIMSHSTAIQSSAFTTGFFIACSALQFAPFLC